LVDNPSAVTITNRNIPIKFHDIKVEYLALAKEMQDKQLPPEDVKKILDVLKKHT